MLDRGGTTERAYRCVAVVLGAVLVTAAVLKLVSAWQGHAGFGPYGGRAVWAGAVTAELCVGTWLAAGAAPATARGAAAAMFTVFFVVASAKAAAGEATCACFGAARIAPAAMAAFDGLALVALAALKPRPRPASPRFLAAAAVFSLSAAALTTGVGLTSPSTIGGPHPPAELHLGVVKAGGTAKGLLRVPVVQNQSGRLAPPSVSCTCLAVTQQVQEGGEEQTVLLSICLDLCSKPEFRGSLRIEVEGSWADGKQAYNCFVLCEVQ
ncbi:hypothetical protein GobsT_66190 [Gemmata obscuriglobus]|nr:hypothetical protein GobsT_66190 [Gemmata obscuriglobus]VTS11120.1 unnamed protein product [Gemmata obscuriglobus UQM 2246]